MSLTATGAPQIKIRTDDGVVHSTITLPRPTKGGRYLNWKEEADPQVNALTSELRPRRFGARPVLRLSYEDIDADDVNNIGRIYNSQYMLDVWPHSDGNFHFYAYITDFDYRKGGGVVYHNAVTIEFTAKSLMTVFPTIDQMYTLIDWRVIRLVS